MRQPSRWRPSGRACSRAGGTSSARQETTVNGLSYTSSPMNLWSKARAPLGRVGLAQVVADAARAADVGLPAAPLPEQELEQALGVAQVGGRARVASGKTRVSKRDRPPSARSSPITSGSPPPEASHLVAEGAVGEHGGTEVGVERRDDPGRDQGERLGHDGLPESDDSADEAAHTALSLCAAPRTGAPRPRAGSARGAAASSRRPPGPGTPCRRAAAARRSRSPRTARGRPARTSTPARSRDVARRAVDQLEVARDDPDHAVPEDAAQAHHRARRERVQQHLHAGARERVEQERRGGDRPARRTAPRPRASRRSPGAAPARPRGPTATSAAAAPPSPRLARRAAKKPPCSTSARSRSSRPPSPRRPARRGPDRQAVQADAEAQQVREADLAEDRLLPLGGLVVEHPAQVVARPLDRLRRAAQQARQARSAGRVGREQERPRVGRLRVVPLAERRACRRWGCARSCRSARRPPARRRSTRSARPRGRRALPRRRGAPGPSAGAARELGVERGETLAHGPPAPPPTAPRPPAPRRRARARRAGPSRAPSASRAAGCSSPACASSP